MDANLIPYYNFVTSMQFPQCPYILEQESIVKIEPSTKQAKRAWNKAQIKQLYSSTKDYCTLTGKSFEFLTYEDYVIISSFTDQSPMQCMKKIREISATGSLAPGAWSTAEDELLTTLVNSKVKKWGQIAEQVNKVIHSGLKIRSGKQCKERWLNHLDPNMKRDKWSESEDLHVLKLYKSLGNKWSEISKIIGNRTDSSIKNRVKSLMNKQKQELKFNENKDTFLDSIINKFESTLTK
ncbi:hypothetical protein SteCoe_31442 [Stentor coeruleus]|uniref:Myb-like DNA-binding domain containing protein n=1 Tax=Stentor coeruleus TaxID=5963 RepID=A0A1R2B1A9_9CILI|nr:hypothetical protein SteCoe_31442 [Stentor coeruleus]